MISKDHYVLYVCLCKIESEVAAEAKSGKALLTHLLSTYKGRDSIFDNLKTVMAFAEERSVSVFGIKEPDIMLSSNKLYLKMYAVLNAADSILLKCMDDISIFWIPSENVDELYKQAYIQ